MNGGSVGVFCADGLGDADAVGGGAGDAARVAAALAAGVDAARGDAFERCAAQDADGGRKASLDARQKGVRRSEAAQAAVHIRDGGAQRIGDIRREDRAQIGRRNARRVGGQHLAEASARAAAQKVFGALHGRGIALPSRAEGGALERALEGDAVERVAAVASIDIKEDEEAVLRLARDLRVPSRFYSSEELNSLQGEFTSSQFVRHVTDVDCVCERSAAMASGGNRFLLRKTAEDGMTVAVCSREITPRFV